MKFSRKDRIIHGLNALSRRLTDVALRIEETGQVTPEMRDNLTAVWEWFPDIWANVAIELHRTKKPAGAPSQQSDMLR